MTVVGIVGGGVIGSTIAYELSKIPSLNVVLFEENLELQGSTKFALGVLVGISSQKKSGRAWELRQESIKRYPKLIEELQDLTQSPISHNSHGLVHLCFSQESLLKWKALKQFRQERTLEIWQPEKLMENCPQISSNKNIVGALYSPSDWQINPISLVKVLQQAIVLNGGQIKLGQKISRIVNNENTQELKGVLLDNDLLFTLDFLVISAGLGSVDLVQKLNSELKLQPVLGQAMHIKLEQEQTREFHPVITGNDIHIVPLNEGEYWVGATVEFPTEQTTIKPNAQLLEEVLQGAISFQPSLAKARILRTWSGNRPRPIGTVAPVIERLESCRKIILATGHYRNGVLLAPATALIVKDMILSQL